MDPDRQGASRGQVTVAMVIVAAVTFVCFLPALDAGFLNWDDETNFLENPAYRGLSWSHLHWMFFESFRTVRVGNYQPLTWVSHAIDHALFGMEPRGYHLVNVLLHAANAALALELFLLVLARARPRAGRLSWVRVGAAAAGALFFALHPLRVESVAWITERRDVLSLLFLLLAVIAYLRRHGIELSARARALWLGASLLAFALSLASKAWGITLPAVLLVLDLYPLRRPLATAPKAIIVEKIPYLVIAVPFAVMALVAQTEALASLSQHTLGARLLQSVQGLWFYLVKTVAPFGLSPIYELEAPGEWLSGALLPIAGLAALTAFAIVRRRAWPGLVTALACYAIIVSPVLGFFQSGSQKVADRYSYVACLPWACLLAAILESGLLASRPWPWRAALAGLVVVVLTALGVLTFRQTRYWRSSLALWEYAVTRTPGSAIAQFNLGYALQQTGEQKGAIEHYVLAVERLPQWAKLQSNLGMAYLTQRAYDLALRHLDEAVRLDASDFHAFTNRGLAHQNRGELEAAIADYTRALELNPRDVRACNNRGVCRLRLRDWDGAVQDLARAVELSPEQWQGWASYGQALAGQGRRGPALEALRKARAMAPPEMHAQLDADIARLGARG